MSAKKEPEQLRKLFIVDLSYETTEESLKSHFAQWGEVVGCVVVIDHQTRKSRGYGFITYKRAHMVDDAQAARPHIIDGREVKSKRAYPWEDRGKPGVQGTVNKLYVRGITDDLEEEDLRNYFGPYGNIVSVNVVTDKNTGRKRSFAFVEFDDYDPVDKIVLQRHNYKGRELVVQKPLSREMKMQIAMGGFRGGRGGSSGGRGERSTFYEFYRGGYGGGYGGGCGGGYANGYGDIYGSGGGGGWGSSFWSCYGGGHIRGNNGYSQRNQVTYGGGRGAGGYGRLKSL